MTEYIQNHRKLQTYSNINARVDDTIWEMLPICNVIVATLQSSNTRAHQAGISTADEYQFMCHCCLNILRERECYTDS